MNDDSTGMTIEGPQPACAEIKDKAVGRVKIKKEDLNTLQILGPVCIEGKRYLPVAEEYSEDLIRLARLGLWAEEHETAISKALIECRDYRAEEAASGEDECGPAEDHECGIMRQGYRLGYRRAKAENIEVKANLESARFELQAQRGKIAELEEALKKFPRKDLER